ncbi:Sec-independent protein translocase subunit TatA [Nocardioides litoris]|uniref:Sec-independent protein translocase subunit TatA n=1 Tax=Nocardioides litoris TaxID=1926648 RepID=UPI0011205CFC|nr:Sec-independent protein translocase subunit TatA [Nocardioides litoris]
MNTLAIGGLGTTELLIIFGVIILLFGAAKLPELARGSGRALRIFKAETKGLMDDDDDKKDGTRPEGGTSAELPGSVTAEQVDTPESTRRSDPA